MTNVLITGANRGIGLEFARQYAANGARVFACCRAPDKATDLQALAKAHDNITVHALDVKSNESVAALKAELGDTPLDHLINNAGVMGGKNQSLNNIDFGEWRACFEANTLGPFRMIAAFADNVAASDEKKIMTVSSYMGSIGRKGQGAYIYRSSKAAVNMVATLAATELAGRGVMSIPVHPGWVRTDMGGAGADISTEESVTGLRKVIAELTPERSGRFWNYNGEELDW